MQWVWDLLAGWLQPIDSPDIRINRTSRGFSLILNRQTSPPAATPPASGMNFKGVYNHSSTYNPGDVVAVTSGPSQGIFVWTGTAPTTAVDPTYPMTTSWYIIALGIKPSNACQGTGTSTYVNASAPF